MATNRIVQGTYADFKLVKTRGVVQMVIEIPVGEAAENFMEMFGLPNPNEEVWVAVAELNRETVGRNEEAVAAIRSAGMLCNNKNFGAWLKASRGMTEVVPEKAESVAIALRAMIGVKSRTELENNPDAIKAFYRVKAEFDEFVMGV